MRAYLDFDDVLAESFKALAAFAEEEFGATPAPGKETHFDLHVSLGLGEGQYEEFMERFHATRLLSVEEIPGACETLRGWLADGIEPVVVTGRPCSTHADSVLWLERRGLGGVEVLHVDKYARFQEHEKAGTVPFGALRDYGFALAVDDAPAALDALSTARMCPYAVFSRPWNAGWKPPENGAAPALATGDWRLIDALARRLAGLDAPSPCR